MNSSTVNKPPSPVVNSSTAVTPTNSSVKPANSPAKSSWWNSLFGSKPATGGRRKGRRNNGMMTRKNRKNRMNRKSRMNRH